MTKRTTDPKAETLRQRGCLHPHPDKVADELVYVKRVLRPPRLRKSSTRCCAGVRLDGDTISQTARGLLPGRRRTPKAAWPPCCPKNRGRSWLSRSSRPCASCATRRHTPTQRHRPSCSARLVTLSPSAQHRACPGSTGKKNSFAVSPPCAAHGSLRGVATGWLMRPRLTRRLGLAVLQQYGLAAWMAQWSKIAVPTTASGAPARFPVLPDDINTEVIKVLAAMALGHLQEDRV